MSRPSVPSAAAGNPVLKGILLNLSAILLFTLMDATAKHLIEGGAPVLQVIWVRYVGQTAIVLVMIAPKLPGALITRHPWHQAGRSLAQFGASIFFFVSLGTISLASATAIADMNPLLITLGAALFLGEPVGPRRLAAVGVAILGALLILRPGSDVFTPMALYPVACALSFAAFALLTRAMGPGEPIATSLFYSALVGTVITTFALPFVWQPIPARDLWAYGAIAILGTAAQMFLIRAYASAPASVIAPFGYTGIPLAALWGLVFFNEVPDGLTILGALVIVGAGLYVWHRENRAPGHG